MHACNKFSLRKGTIIEKFHFFIKTPALSFKFLIEEKLRIGVDLDI